jgi:hypothetical protein
MGADAARNFLSTDQDRCHDRIDNAPRFGHTSYRRNHGCKVRGSQVYNEAGAERAWVELMALKMKARMKGKVIRLSGRSS